MNTTLDPMEIVIRLLVAVVAGVALGIDRDLEGKPTGVRTLGLVSLGAAAITIATFYLGEIHGDLAARSRVLQGLIQGILTGIGFIGAGAVLRRETRKGKAVQVSGLTTAANVLVVAGIGVACGLGAWVVVLATLTLALILLAILHPLEKALERIAKQRKQARKATAEPPPDMDAP